MNMKTNYPWDGAVSCDLTMKKKSTFAIAFRIPGWSKGIPSPGELYVTESKPLEKPLMKVNGLTVEFIEENGYAVINREWKSGDKIEYILPMDVKRVQARKELKADAERIAIQRGPIIYCVEGADNKGKAWNILAPSSSSFQIENFKVQNENVVSIVSDLPVLQIGNDGMTANTTLQKVRAIPYYTWCNRGSNPMQVWLPVALKDIKINY